MKLYHYYRSSASYRVRIALALKQLAWDAAPVHLGNGEHRTDQYGLVAAAGLVPVLVDGDATIAQSLAIIEYLDETYDGPRLLPLPPIDRAYVRELALDIGCEIHPLNNTRVLTYLGERMGQPPEHRDGWYRHWTELGLGVVERKLERSKRHGTFCFADTPGVADCFLVPQIFNAKRLSCDLTKLPRVMKIFEACMARVEFASTQPSAFEPVSP